MTKTQAPPQAALQLEQLKKSFDDFEAVRDLNLSVAQGEIFGFLGPNGAGKTTTLLLLLGLLRPTAGKVVVFGEVNDAHQPEVRRRLGVVLERQQPYPELTAKEFLTLFGSLYGVADLDRRIDEVLALVSLSPRLDSAVGSFSHGMQLKLSLARAILHEPDLLILDEPVEGLDPNSIREVRDILLEYHARGKTILLSSHILSEVERLADRVGILNRGRLLAVGDMRALRDHFQPEHELLIEAQGGAADLLEHLRRLPFVRQAGRKGERLSVLVPAGQDYRGDLARALAEAGAVTLNIERNELSLEQMFAAITAENVEVLAGGAAAPSATPSTPTPAPSVRSRHRAAGRGRRDTVRTLWKQGVRSLAWSPAPYVLLAATLLVAAAVTNSYLGFVASGSLIVLAQPWLIPLQVGTFLMAFYLGLSATVTLAADRVSGTLLVLFFGPVDEWGYVLGLWLSRVTVFAAWLAVFGLTVLGYGWWSGLTFSLTQLLTAAAYSFFPLAILAALGPLVAVAMPTLRGAVFGFLGLVIGLEALRWANTLLALLAAGRRSFIWDFARELSASLTALAGWASPFQYLQRSLSAGSVWEALGIGAAAAVYTALLLVASVWLMRRRTVLP